MSTRNTEVYFNTTHEKNLETSTIINNYYYIDSVSSPEFVPHLL